ncbi:ion transporter [Halovulum dunhuangense]|uniref:Ion transporter n=1 Tax=Halovulum dunhuangense TaxID=1505036 RepID=A0A849L119_9RHOB|nr:ion transporter [Halovulum dunhuangense]NNU79972.1 ion transporter [Halovulum dunhuangense]
MPNSLPSGPGRNAVRDRLKTLIENPRFERAILILIAVNAVTLGLETSAAVMERIGGFLKAFDKAILAVFVIEIAARLYVDFRGFWRDPWRIFDFSVVAISLIPATGPLSVLRAFRVLRILRLISGVKAMRRVVAGLLEALPGMGSIVLLLVLIFYVTAVISTMLFGQSFPDWFGTLPASAYTLFQIMTLESWSMGIVRPVMEVYPLAWLLFIPFILSTAFTVLNLFIGVIVDAMQSEHEAEAQGERDALQRETEAILAEVRALRADVAALRGDQPQG